MAGVAPEAAAFDPIALGTEIQRRIGVKTSRDEPLARFTTMRVGGRADLFAVAHNAFELRALVKLARNRGVPHVVLGRGSDVVIADAGVRGLVIQVRAEGTEVRDERLVAEAGVPMARAATVTQGAGLSGLEFGLAIPGTVGGAVWANAGAHESDVRAILESAQVLAADGTEARLDAAALGLDYRDSRLKHPPAGGPAEVVLTASFRLAPRPRRDPRPARRDPPLAPGPPAARAAERRVVLPRTRPGTRPVGSSRRPASRERGSVGPRSATSTPTSWSTIGRARRPTSVGSASSSGPRSAGASG